MVSNMAMGFVVCLFAVMVVFPGVEAFCFLSGPTGPGSSCEYEGHVFASGSSYKAPAPHCVECSCEDGGMSCCGYGKNAGPVNIDGCKQVNRPNSCELFFVDARRPNRPCRGFRR
ncbi:beta-microseminoprotein-like [Dreissena polymorpha]|uniref:Beta-microseminoprotein-like n=1 Tax=Dreissena polymorpha TaxID=45954 RepID=A0A9D4HKY1_DREPO|nr:beta-microseminoprotein-like [Dreissena polymorpha]KAH3721369.1 hypothetical protein DPMN_064292 [Dreissena polymorpha]